MKNPMPFYLIMTLLVLSSCSTALYQPNTVNVPTVDTTHNKEFKVSPSYQAIDFHGNYLSKTSSILFQAQANLQTMALNPEFNQIGPRLGLGIGKLWSLSSHHPISKFYNQKDKKIYASFQLATSSFSDFQGSSGNFLDLLTANQSIWGIDLTGRQWHYGVLFGSQYERRNTQINNSFFIDLNYCQAFQIHMYQSYLENGEKLSHSYDFQNLYYVMGNIQSQIVFAKYVQLSIGLKAPLYVNKPNFPSQLNFTSESFYLRLNIWLRH